jgi:hypothetical protein
VLSAEENEQGVAEPPHTVEVLVDRANPAVTITSDQNRTEYLRDELATVTTTASDGGSGLAQDPSGRGQRIATNTTGDKSVTRTASDLCGNATTATFRYRVVEAGVLSAQPCTSRRSIVIHLAKGRLKGAGVVSVRMTIPQVNRRLRVVRRGPRDFVTRVDLRGLERGRFTVRIRVKLDDGRVLTGVRRYHTCTSARPGGNPKL